MTVAETPEWLVQFVQAVDRHGRMWDVVDRFVPDDVRVAAGLDAIGDVRTVTRTVGDVALLEASMLLGRVRDLHKPVGASTGMPWCECCVDDSGDTAEWPCDTARIVYTDDEITKATT